MSFGWNLSEVDSVESVCSGAHHAAPYLDLLLNLEDEIITK